VLGRPLVSRILMAGAFLVVLVAACVDWIASHRQ